MAKGNNNMARMTGAASLVREEDLEDLEDLLKELRGRVDKAREDGRTFMMAQHIRLVAMVQPEVKRLRDRFDREALAAQRREQKMLKLEQGEQDQQGATA